ncbi:L-rhamnose-binding lectin SML-like [Gasterosteus aculeatus]
MVVLGQLGGLSGELRRQYSGEGSLRWREGGGAGASFVTCSIIRAVDSTKKVTTCYNGANVQRLSCDTGVIQVDSALYGRKDKETCSEEIPPNQLADTTCSLAGTTALVKTGCDGKRECELNPNTVRTSDPCRGISKYLQTIYSCFPAIHFATCEGSLADRRAKYK